MYMTADRVQAFKRVDSAKDKILEAYKAIHEAQGLLEVAGIQTTADLSDVGLEAHDALEAVKDAIEGAVEKLNDLAKVTHRDAQEALDTMGAARGNRSLLETLQGGGSGQGN